LAAAGEVKEDRPDIWLVSHWHCGTSAEQIHCSTDRNRAFAKLGEIVERLGFERKVMESSLQCGERYLKLVQDAEERGATNQEMTDLVGFDWSDELVDLRLADWL
jgi:hypothetical protein